MLTGRVLGAASALLLAEGAAPAATLFNEDFSTGYNVPYGFDRIGVVPGWTITGSVDSALVLDSAAYDTYAAGVGDTGTGKFLAYGAGNSPDDGVATMPLISAGGSGRPLTLSLRLRVLFARSKLDAVARNPDQWPAA